MKEFEGEEMEPAVLRRALKLVHHFTGITMPEGKKSLLEGRLRTRIRELSLSGYTPYFDYLEANPAETQVFINSVTTNETSFFRTPGVWKFFRDEYLPKWHKEHPGTMMRIWSAASSTGQETYTLAICCQEFKNMNPTFDYMIAGSDIDTGVIEEATTGEYKGRSIAAFQSAQPALFTKYMTAIEDRFRVSDKVRPKIKFSLHNLFKAPPVKAHYDLVFCRNVLIYFEDADQERVLSNMASALTPKGILVIGESESLTRLKTSFVPLAPLIYAKA